MRNESRPPRADYDFFLMTVNPNKMTVLWYRSGSAVLLHAQGEDAGQRRRGAAG